MEWQPIETAPKDGRSFIGYNPFTEAHEAYWDASAESWVIRTWHTGMEGPWFPGLTHWMPLPEPPK